MKLKITIPIRPVPMGRSKSTKAGHHYTPIKTRLYQERAAIFVKQAMDGVSFPPGIITLKARFYFTPPKSWSRKKRDEALENVYFRPTGREGDVSNLAKNLEDVLEKVGLLQNDKDIVHLEATKFFSEDERTECEVTCLVYEYE